MDIDMMNHVNCDNGRLFNLKPEDDKKAVQSSMLRDSLRLNMQNNFHGFLIDFLTLSRVIYTCPAHVWEDQRVLNGTWIPADVWVDQHVFNGARPIIGISDNRIDKGKDSVNPLVYWINQCLNNFLLRRNPEARAELRYYKHIFYMWLADSNPSPHEYWVGITLLDSHLYEIFRIS
ncbi:hypothetical protein T01_1171 [Trichinella spiralis]|uniref:Uncharacterized protein n=1 Tax=Trichinella spiralis TaxID=6334 RepID=A0A0V1AUM8_TRISP|nr:hypothetical protein T01_1171 [Trichinella spiralis]